MKLDRKGPSIIARYYPWLVWFVCNGMPLQPVWDQGVGWLFLEQATTRLRCLVWWLKDSSDAGFFKGFQVFGSKHSNFQAPAGPTPGAGAASYQAEFVWNSRIQGKPRA